MIRDLQELLGISAKNRREHESKEMTIEDLVAEFNADVADYQKTVEYALEEFIVIVRAYQAGKIHPNVIKYVYGVTLDEIFEAIDAHYTILDDDGNPMKPKDFQKYIDIKASNLCRKNLSDYGLNMEEKN